MQQLRQLGLDRGFTLEVTGDTSVVTAAQLANYRAVVFLNTKGDYLTDAQQAAFEAYFGAGGGFVGIGSAVELEPGWAVPDRRPRLAVHGQARRPDRHQQGRRPGP